MSKYRKDDRLMNVVVIKKWKDGGEATMEYFSSTRQALSWIEKQNPPKSDEFQWCVGSYKNER